MTPEEQDLVLSLVTVPGRGAPMPPAEFLQRFGATDGPELGLQLLRSAIERQDPTDVELSLVVCAVFDVTTGHFDELLQLLPADWHTSHEEVVTALGEYRSPAAVDALYQATQVTPEYLDWDESRGLAKKAIRALGATPGEEADAALQRLLTDEDEEVRTAAEKAVSRRPPA